jgi:TonB-linked SusC/RagA family outer membrane protein
MDFTALCSIPRRRGFTKTMRIMKITALIILLGFLHLSATSFSQNVTLSLKNTSLDRIFTEIERQTGYNFIYFQNQLDKTRAIDLEAVNLPLESTLELVFKNQPLTYSIEKNFIVVKQKPPTVVGVNTNNSMAPPPGDIHGHITDSLGHPLVGATVYIRKLKKSLVTDAKGEFSLKNVPDGEYEVAISYIGYETYTTKITVANHGAMLTAALKQSMSKLDETVVKGYYNTTDRLNTGDVSTVKAAVIEEQPVSDPILALEGRVPGLYIQQTSGVPGAYSTIMLRGQNFIHDNQNPYYNDNDPLYIVDGVPYSSTTMTSEAIGGGVLGYPSNNIGSGMSPFNYLNPADIESITVLKDADATAIYGSRGANGVILITTKKGRVGKTKFDVNVYSGAGQVTKTFDFLSTQQYLQMRRQAFQNDGLAVPSIITNPNDNNYDIDGVWDTTRYTNWQKVLIDNPAHFTNAQTTISGGNTNTQFVIAGGYSNQGTLYSGNFSDKKASARVNLTHLSENQRFHFQLSANYMNDNSNLPQIDFTSAITLAPDAPAIYNQNGTINWQPLDGTNTWNNPMANILTPANAISDNLISNLNIGYELFPGLYIKSNLGYTHTQMNQSIITPASSYPPPQNTFSFNRTLAQATTDNKTWIIEPQLNYQHNISRGHLDVLIGSTFQQNVQTSIGTVASGYVADALIPDPLAASTFQILGNTYTLYRYNAAYGRINYNWNEKYLFNLTGRRDGSSRFGPGKQFGNFGAIGAGWIFSKEHFVQDNLSFLSFGKLRASYGTTGSDQITDYQFLSTYSANSSTYQGITELYPTRITNPYYAWEVVKKLEGGLDLGFWKDRILVNVSYYRNKTNNQLVGYPLPRFTGFSSVQANFPANIQNTGYEFTLNTVNIKARHLTWTSSVNLTIPNNKLVSYPDIASSPYQYTYVVGKSLFIKEMFHYTGINSQTGLYTFETKNSNGLPSYPRDIFATKPVTQQYYGGFQNGITYDGFRLDIFFQFVKQLGANYLTSFLYPSGSVNQNQPAFVQKNTNLFTTSFSSNAGNSYNYLTQSDATISDASFIRLKNVALSYQLPSEWQKRMHLQMARLYLQIQNLLTITHYQGLDPETGGLNLPPLRMITAGVQVAL